ncbi:MAG: hypothetical protein RLZZ127_799 [Planctomycetota bacterium]|jgi:hypothetical protein
MGLFRAAFNARPLGMPIPPNWIGLAAFAMLGFVNPGFWLIGAGLEAAYLTLLMRSPRFRAAVTADGAPPAKDLHRDLLAGIPAADREIQARLEARGAELAGHLDRTGALGGQQDQVAQLCWLHLRLLAARQGVAAVAAAADPALARRRDRLAAQVAASEDAEIRTSLESQLAILDERLRGHREAASRLRFIDAELERIRQQVELAREQALLAQDAAGIARSVDIVAGSLGEANRWLSDRRDILADLDPLAEAPAADRLFAPRPKATA